jgi:coenzyme F420-reducing hydrogenase alpha subunit
VKWVADLPFPDFEQEYTFVALSHLTEYPFNEGRLLSNKGLDIAVQVYDASFTEEHVPYSSALHSTLNGHRAYLTGPLARYALNYEQLSPLVKETACAINLDAPCCNPFKSIIVRSLETLYAIDEAITLIEHYEEPAAPALEVHPRAATGYACTEAPRGTLYHRYTIDNEGQILEAKIVPPTSQNQKAIESDLRHFVAQSIHLPDEELTWKCEQAIRNYDPCISCSTHFLKLQIEREGDRSNGSHHHWHW